MVRVWSRILVVALMGLFVASVAFAQDDQGTKKKGRQTPEERKAAAEKRFDDMEKAAKHDPLTGQLTKDEFVAAVKEINSKMGDRAEQMFTRITKADENKVTKDEYVKAMTTRTGRGGKKGGGGGNGGGGNGT